MTVHLTQAAAAAHRPARYHFEAPHVRFVPRGRSACGGLPLDRASGRDPADVPVDRRCRGRGCAERWGRARAARRLADRRGGDRMTARRIFWGALAAFFPLLIVMHRFEPGSVGGSVAALLALVAAGVAAFFLIPAMHEQNERRR